MLVYAPFSHGSTFVNGREIYFTNGQANVSDSDAEVLSGRPGYKSDFKRGVVIALPEIVTLKPKLESPLSPQPFPMPKEITVLDKTGVEVMENYWKEWKPIEADNLVPITNMKHRDDIEVSIVIPTNNRLDDLKRCINSIYEHTHGITYEIVVADGANSDKSVYDYVSKHTPIVYVKEKRKVGCMRAFNIGFKFSMGEYIVWLNDDVIVEKDWLKIALEYMKSHPDVGLGAIYHKEGAIVGKDKNLIHGYLFNSKDEDYCVRTMNKMTKHPGMIYANFGIVRLDLMKKLGYWDDKTYKSYVGDNDFSHKIWDIGLKVAAIPNCKIQHLYTIDDGRIENSIVYQVECRLYSVKWGMGL